MRWPCLLVLAAALALAPVRASHAEGAEGAQASAHGGGGEEEATYGLLPHLVNFVLFFGLLAFLVRKPVGDLLTRRRKEIDDALSAAERARVEAQRKLAEMDAKLAALEAEIPGILAKAREQAEAQRQHLLEAAESEAARIVQQAEAQVADLEAGAVRRLKATAADLAVEMARDLVTREIKPEDRQKLFDRYLKSLQKAAS